MSRMGALALALLIALSAARAETPARLLEHGRAVASGGSFAAPGGAPCLHCHGLHGAGDGSGAFPRLAGQSPWYLYKSLQDYASGVRPSEAMSPIAKAMSAADMEAVAAWYSAQDAPWPPAPEPAPLVLQRGGAISAVGAPERGVQACAGCHGAEGRGQPPVTPYLAGQYEAYLRHQLESWREGERGGDPLGVMQRIAQAMTPEDIRAAAAYFAAIRPSQSRPDR